jgi:hypothetical protein
MPKEEYDQYIANIKEYLESDDAKKFSIEHFIETMMGIITSSP